MSNSLSAPPAFAASLGGIIRPAHLNEYFGPWAIEGNFFRSLAESVGSIDLRAHVAETPAGSLGDPTERRNAVAVINLCGPLMKQVSSLTGGCSTVEARRAIREAIHSEAVGSILLRIDSPGGTVAGTRALADEVAKAAEKKPVYAYIEDLGASAAYWIASQASRVYADGTALVGSIGTFAVLHDSSERAEKLGVRVYVIRAGEHKGAGTPGAPLAEEHVSEAQRVVDSLNEHFLRAVADGRGFSESQVRELADGRVHVGAEALALGLVDGIKDFDDVLAEMSGSAAPAAEKGNQMKTDQHWRGRNARAEMDEDEDEKTRSMDDEDEESAEEDEDEEPEAEEDDGEDDKPGASYKRIKSACIGADSDFICKALEKGYSVKQATRAWMIEQNKRNERLASTPARRPKKSRGLSPVSTGGASSASSRAADDPASEFERLVRARMQDANESWAKACGNVARDNPEMQRAFLLKHNSGNVAHLIGKL